MKLEVATTVTWSESLISDWGELARSSRSGVFATPEWHFAVQAGYGDRGSALVATIRDQNRLVGVAPLRLGKRYMFRDATLLGMGESGYGVADYAGILAEPGREAEVADALVNWIRADGSWDLLDLQQLPDGALTDALVVAIRRAGIRFRIQRQNICHVVALPATWAEYRSGLSAGSREWLEKRPRKLERDLGAWVDLVEPHRLVEEYPNLRRLQARRFGGYPDEPERRLTKIITAWLPMAQQRGWAKMFCLRCKSSTIGWFLGYEYQAAFYAHSIAFEPQPERTRYSLGASLLAFALKWSIDRGLKRFDLMRGDHRYKDRLGGELQPNFRLLAFGPPIRGRAIEMAVRARARLKNQASWPIAHA